MRADELDPSSWLVKSGRPSMPGAPLNVSPALASNFIAGGDHYYSRNEGTETWEALETLVGGLEGGYATSFASGMAAVAAVFDQLTTGAHILLPDDCYQGVGALAAAGERRGRWSVERIATADTTSWLESISSADLVWLESPSNPLLIVADLGAICRAPRKVGSILAVDNTFATPLHQRPLQIGADVSVHSATKFIGGHSDLLAGVTVATSSDLAHALRTSRQLGGATPGAFEAFLAVRGARTLAVRMERSQANAMELALRLQHDASVGVVRYPGLATHPTHAIAREQLDGYGSVLSFDLADAATADRACAAIKLIHNATSLGGVESTMERRSTMAGQEHLPAGLIRLSVGIEDIEDLWDDLHRALH